MSLFLNLEKELDKLRSVWIEAGGKAGESAVNLMYERLYMCFIQDPFGAHILLYSHLS